MCTICTNNHQQFQQFVLFIGFELHVNFITFKWALQNILYLNSKNIPNLNGDHSAGDDADGAGDYGDDGDDSHGGDGDGDGGDDVMETCWRK